MRTSGILGFLAVILTALAMLPAGAHLAELPHKIALSQKDYFVVQGIYRGWALFGVALCSAIVVNFIFALTLRRQPRAFRFAVLGFVLVAASLLVFFTWTYPVNVATSNWTQMPANWRELRRQWEYSHAAAAVLDFLSLCSVTLAILLRGD